MYIKLDGGITGKGETNWPDENIQDQEESVRGQTQQRMRSIQTRVLKHLGLYYVTT